MKTGIFGVSQARLPVKAKEYLSFNRRNILEILGIKNFI